MREPLEVYPYRRVHSEQKHGLSSKFKAGRRVWAAVNQWYKPRSLMYFLFAFLLGRAVILGQLSPFAMAFYAVILTISWGLTLPLLAFTLAGQLTVRGDFSSFWSSLILYLILTFFIHLISKKQLRPLMLGLTVLSVDFVIKIIFSYAFLDPTLYDYLTIGIEAFLAGALIPLFYIVVQGLKKKGKTLFKLQEESISLAIFVLALLLGMNFNLGGFNLGAIISRYLIILAAATGGAGAGASLGAAIGLLPGMTNFNGLILIGIYALSGTLAGLLKPFKKWGVAFGFLAGNFIYSLYFNDEVILMKFMQTSGFALALFFLTPFKLLQTISYPKNESGEKIDEKYLVRRMFERLEQLGKLFMELAAAFEQSGISKERENETQIENILSSLTVKVCQGCSLYRICWEKDLYQTYKNLLEWFSAFKKDPELARDYIPIDLKKRCSRFRELVTGFSCLIDTQQTNNIWQKQLFRERNLVAAQLKGVAEIMNAAAAEVQTTGSTRQDLEEAILFELQTIGLLPEMVGVWQEKEGNLDIRIELERCCLTEPLCLETVPGLISNLIGHSLTIGKYVCSRKKKSKLCSMHLMTAPLLEVNLGFAQRTKQGSEICGDSYSAAALKNGKLPLILSDGMGSGTEACRESRVTINLLNKLLALGFDHRLAVETVNSVLLLRSGEEIFATVDLALLDLRKGTLEFIKVGCTPSLLIQNGKIYLIESDTLPVGIIENIQVESFRYELKPGNLLVMATDGIWQGQQNQQDGWLVSFISAMLDHQPQKLADKIVEKALELQGGQALDDLTVLVARVEKK